jgi:hypothetical protein
VSGSENILLDKSFANKILANDESVKWASKPTDPIKQRSKKVSQKYLRYSYSWLKVLPIKKFF